jgi:hypothetical protein
MANLNHINNAQLFYMKKLFYSMIFLIAVISNKALGQGVGIGTLAPNASAKLDITDTARGILIPRMTAVQRDAIVSPAQGLLVYITNDNHFYFFNAGWKKLVAENEGWGLSGNSGINPATQFIGTTDLQPLRFRAANTSAGQINPTNFNIGLGFNTFDSVTTGDSNVSLGTGALENDTSGDANSAIGHGSLTSNKNGSFNTAMGYISFVNNLSGNNNVALGRQTGLGNITGSGNTFIGTFSNAGSDGLTNATAIGFVSIVSQSNSLVLGGTGGFAVNVGIGTTTPRERLDLNGAITISNGTYGSVSNNAVTPVPAGGSGTIIFSNNHFFGWNGTQWKQLDN